MIVAHESPVGPSIALPPAAVSGRDAIVLRGISWQIYQAIRDEPANDHVPMAYDAGVLELMSPKKQHGKVITLLDRMIYEWARHKHLPLEPGGNMTCDREDLEKGLEPDLCYWIAHEADVRDKDDIDLNRDPPPDLALEVEVSRSSLVKLPIYQALKIPEVWRWRRGVEVLHLGSDGQYERRTSSVELPGFPFELANQLLERRNTMGLMELMERFVTAIADRE